MSECFDQRIALTVDVVIFTLLDNALKVLLIRRRREPFAGMWALPGGFVHPQESLEDAARRVLYEESGATDVYLEQLYTFGHPDRDPRQRVVTVAYFALVSADRLPLDVQSPRSSERGWWPAYEPPPLAFDHADILAYALQRLRYKLEYTAVGFQLLPETFTLTELQMAYETILREQLDKRNFRRKVLAAGILEETDAFKSGGHRPARLYRFRREATVESTARRLFP
nr:NUDIX domain-containing protein [Ardenticatena sp.]